jgi:hypothetical protein
MATEKRTMYLTETNQGHILNVICSLNVGDKIVVGPPGRNLDQNAMLHAVLMDIAAQVEWVGQKLSVDVWKRLCTAAWMRERNAQPLLVPALDGHGVDIIYEKTSKLSVAQCSELIEWCLAFGSEHNVTWSK